MVIVVSKLDWEMKRNINKIIDQLALSRVVKFYPTYIHKITGAPLSDIFNYLLSLVEDKMLVLNWEVRCPDPNCNSIIKYVNKNNKCLDNTLECGNCGNTIVIRKDLIFPSFGIKDDYRSKIRQSKKKEINLLKVL